MTSQAAAADARPPQRGHGCASTALAQLLQMENYPSCSQTQEVLPPALMSITHPGSLITFPCRKSFPSSSPKSFLLSCHLNGWLFPPPTPALQSQGPKVRSGAEAHGRRASVSVCSGEWWCPQDPGTLVTVAICYSWRWPRLLRSAGCSAAPARGVSRDVRPAHSQLTLCFASVRLLGLLPVIFYAS